MQGGAKRSGIWFNQATALATTMTPCRASAASRASGHCDLRMLPLLAFYSLIESGSARTGRSRRAGQNRWRRAACLCSPYAMCGADRAHGPDCTSAT
eukprot:3941886-Rhodomonas_salina.2